MAEMRDFVFDNIAVDNRELDKNSAFFLTGLPKGRIQNITLSNIRMNVSGGGTQLDSQREIKEYTLETLKGWWPEFYLVGTLPASGLYARHIDDIAIDNFHLKIESDDARPPIVFDDVNSGKVSNAYANDISISPIQR